MCENIETEKMVGNMLKDLGIPANLLGYHYLKYTIEVVMSDMSLVHAITKRLYPMVAKRFNTTTARVERAIRTAIETGWLRGNEELITELFGYTVDAGKGKPTNGEFIATVADFLVMERALIGR